MIKSYRTASLFILCLLLTMCAQKAEDKYRVEVKEGIEYVHNSAEPLYPSKSIRFVEELSIFPEDEDGQILIYRPGSYAVDEDGQIYICDLQDQKIKVFDFSGRYVRSIGDKGEGPGEFKNLIRVALLPDGRLITMDWEMKRISLFTRDGQFLTSHKYRNWGYNIYLTTSTLYAREEVIFGPQTQRFVKASDFEGQELFSYGQFEYNHSQEVNEGGRRFSFSRPFDRYSIFAGDRKNGRLYHCLNDKYLIEVFDHEGQLFRKIDRPYDLVPVTESDVERYLDGFRVRGISDKDLALIEKNMEMPKLKTVTDRMIVDDQGNLWIETNETRTMEDGTSTAAFDIFNEDGIYVSKIWTPLSIGLFHKGKMYHLETDKETGFRILKRYGLIWSD